jgi:predicted DNA-binding WGR domain protein
MARPRPDRVHLRRINPERRMWRFYSLALQPTLLGGVDPLVRRWGRTGTVGSSLIQAFPDEPSAQAALDTLAKRKRRRGYT